MATQILYPIGNGLTDSSVYLFTGAAYAWDCVDESTTDENTSYLYLGGSAVSPYRSTFTVQAHSIPSGSTIASVTLTIRARRVSGATTASLQGGVRAGGSGMVSLHPSTYWKYTGTSFSNKTAVWTTNPDTGVAWTLADISSLFIGVLSYDYDTYVQHRVTQLYATITYTPPAARNNIFLIG